MIEETLKRIEAVLNDIVENCHVDTDTLVGALTDAQRMLSNLQEIGKDLYQYEESI